MTTRNITEAEEHLLLSYQELSPADQKLIQLLAHRLVSARYKKRQFKQLQAFIKAEGYEDYSERRIALGA